MSSLTKIKLLNKNAENKQLLLCAGSMYFCKFFNNKREMDREIAGYNIMRKYYPVSNLVGQIKDSSNNLLIFQYEKTVIKNGGLLVDLFANKKKFDKDFLPILKLYRRVFLITLRKNNGNSSNVFIKDRITTRINKFYTKKYIKSFNNKKIILNGRLITIKPSKTIDELKSYFKRQNKNKWCVVSQCDPNDLNIGTRPIIFDYEAGGLTPIMAEYASLFWFNICRGNYLALKYHKELFFNHEKIFKKIDKPFFYKNKITHKPTSVRLDFTKAYTDHVISPCFIKIGTYDNWYEEFKNYLAMRILAVTNISKMEYNDMLLSFAYLEYFYNIISPSSPKELMKEVSKLCKI